MTPFCKSVVSIPPSETVISTLPSSLRFSPLYSDLLGSRFHCIHHRVLFGLVFLLEFLCAVRQCMCVYMHILGGKMRRFLFPFSHPKHTCLFTLPSTLGKIISELPPLPPCPSGSIKGRHPPVLHHFPVLLLCFHNLSAEMVWIQLAQRFHEVSRMAYILNLCQPCKMGWSRGRVSS